MDETLVRVIGRLLGGEGVDDLFEYLSERFRSRLFKYFLSHKFPAADSEDLVQETFRRVFTSIRTLRDATRFESWLFQVARNVRLTARASVHRLGAENERIQDMTDLPVASTVEDPLLASVRKERLKRTWEAVERLSPQQKQCLILCAVHEMSYEEIATVLPLSVRTVRNHLREAV